MIRPYIGWFHPCIPVLTIGYCIAIQSSHEVHLPHTATGILDEVILGFQLIYKIEDMTVRSITELRIFAYRV